MEQTPAAFLEQLKNVVLQRAAEDDLVLPSLPGVASGALAELAKGFDPEALARVIEPDPLVTARLVRVANSAAFSSGPAAITVARAIERVGQTAIMPFLEKIAAERVFTSRDEAINRACRRFWEHSLTTAILARRLAQALPVAVREQTSGIETGALPDAAYMAGLLHDLGKPILAAMLLDSERRLVGNQVTRTWLSADEFVSFVTTAHRTIGLLVAAQWELPALVRHALADPAQYDREDRTAVANIVRLANALAKQAGIHIGGGDAGEVDGLVDNGAGLLGVPSMLLPKLCEGVADEVAQKVT